MELVKLTGIGLILGMITVIPGLSVGTMAVVLNVYDRLIGVITPNIKKILGAWKFWLPLVLGGVVGLVLFSKVVTILYERFPLPTVWFFIGVIAGSIPLVYGRVRRDNSPLPSLPSAICAVLALAVMVVMAVFRPEEGTTVYTELTPQIFGMLALAGMLAAIAMIIPGISGAFLLLVTGMYRTVLQAVSSLNIPLLTPLVIGAGAGLLIGAALVRFLLARAPRETYGAVLGLVAGSVIVLFPGGFGDGVTLIFSILCLLAGGAVSFFMGRQNKSDNRSEQDKIAAN
jgi:putative membrane protein